MPILPYAQRLSQIKNIEFEAIDVSQNEEMAKYMKEKTGQTGVPQTNVGGTWVVGFDRKKIDELLSIS